MLEWPVIELRERIQYLNLEGDHDHLRIAVGARRRLRNYGLHASKVKAVSAANRQLGPELRGLPDTAGTNAPTAPGGQHRLYSLLAPHPTRSRCQGPGCSQ